jgi:hypothetical protein
MSEPRTCPKCGESKGAWGAEYALCEACDPDGISLDPAHPDARRAAKPDAARLKLAYRELCTYVAGQHCSGCDVCPRLPAGMVRG